MNDEIQKEADVTSYEEICADNESSKSKKGLIIAGAAILGFISGGLVIPKIKNKFLAKKDELSKKIDLISVEDKDTE